MAQPYPLPREIRSTGELVFDGVSQVYGPIDFKIFDIEDVAVYVKHDGETSYTRIEGLTVTKTADLAYDTFSVDFGEVHPVTSSYVIQGERTPERSTGVTRGGGIDTQALEKDISKLAIEDQELRRELGRAVKSSPGSTAPDLPEASAGKLIGWNSDGDALENKTDFDTSETLPATASTYLKRDASGEEFEAKTPGEVLEDIEAVKGPSSSTDGNIVQFDGTTGKLVKDSGAEAVAVTEGTFTPTVSFATPNDLSVSYDTQEGSYQRIGNRVHFNIFLQFTPTHSTASGTFTVSGLPVQSKDNSGSGYAVAVLASHVGFESDQVQMGARVEDNNTTITLRFQRDELTFQAGNPDNFPTGETYVLMFNGSYPVEAS